MAKSKIVKANEKIAESVTGGFQKICDGVTGGFQKMSNGVVGGYTKIEDAFVDRYLTKNSETVEDAKARLKAKEAALQEKSKAQTDTIVADSLCRAKARNK